jgi:4-hydroxy-4-methyl-2-oxoglutarate aldolase
VKEPNGREATTLAVPGGENYSLGGCAVLSTFNLEQIELLSSFDTCLISEAIEAFGVRLRNEGFATAGFRCLFKSLPPMVGYAATCKVRSADPPMVGSRYIERTDWWRHITSISAPRVVVIQDIDKPPGTGAFLGKVHVHILAALGCVGAVTNGAARELPGIEAARFQVFAGRLAMSRAYVHIVEYGGPVEVGSLTIKPGDLIHGDRHGILTIPPGIADQLPAVARQIMEKENQVIELSKRRGVSFKELGEALRDLLDSKASSNRESERKR